MAAIDKTYISDWETFDKIRNWALDKKFTLKNGREYKIVDYIYEPDLTKEEWDKRKARFTEKYPSYTFEVVLWSTPAYADIWLIHNCPFEEIQNRLKEQYSGGWSKTAFTDHNESDLYEQIKNGTSIYDTYQRNGLGWKSKVKFHTIYGGPIRDKLCSYWITVNPYWINGKETGFSTDNSPWYNHFDDAWYWDIELMPWTSSCCIEHGYLSKKKIVRMVKKWNFPKGTIVYFRCEYKRYRAYEFYITVE